MLAVISNVVPESKEARMEASKWRSRKFLAAGTALGAALMCAAVAGMQFSDSRPFCSVCHVMGGAALTQSQSPHARLACNDCHAPHNLAAKLPFKAREGLRDFMANMQGREVPVQARLETRDVVNANCIACHQISTEDVMMAKPYCVDCHRGVAHQKKQPVSFREAADE